MVEDIPLCGNGPRGIHFPHTAGSFGGVLVLSRLSAGLLLPAVKVQSPAGH